MRIETLIIVASEVFSSRAKADRGTHLPSRWFFGLSTNKRKPAQRAGLSAEETKVYALTLIVASALFSPSALTVSVTVPPV